MVFSLLVSAIVWNLGTWWLGLPASSSHTLIGSIIGVGVANALMGPTHAVTDGVNWAKAQEVGIALLVSPLVGFCAAALLLIVARLALNTIAGRGDELPPDLNIAIPDTWLFNHRWEKGGHCPKTQKPLARAEIGGRTTCWSPARQKLHT